jgi:hypothetical protein
MNGRAESGPGGVVEMPGIHTNLVHSARRIATMGRAGTGAPLSGGGYSGSKLSSVTVPSSPAARLLGVISSW